MWCMMRLETNEGKPNQPPPSSHAPPPPPPTGTKMKPPQILGLGQTKGESARETLRNSKIFCFVAFVLGILLFLVFLLVGQVRYFKIVNYIVAFVIMDLTERVSHLFIVTFILLLVSVYFLIVHVHVTKLLPYAFLIFELSLSVVVFLAQTIKGDRFAQMSDRDALLASLILFHEFLTVYTLTFFWQITYAYFTPEDYSRVTESAKQYAAHHYGDGIAESGDASGLSVSSKAFAHVNEADVGDAKPWNGTGTPR
ncbi:GL25028 [Drosophila persimilis]|uniref:GL25028 n=1 Tax=Drosophila persimilis TaxID=7234 RepID=B4GU82_DROPE|nr:GL25028 [Drosophila persimilis]